MGCQIILPGKGMITLGTQEQGEAIKEVNGVKLTVQVLEITLCSC